VVHIASLYYLTIISRKILKKTQRKRKNLKKKTSRSSSEESNTFSVNVSIDESPDCCVRDDAKFLYCEGLFSEDVHGEQWIQCVSCSRWAHEEFAGIETDIFICEFCKKRLTI